MYTGEEIKKKRAEMQQNIIKGFFNNDINKAKESPEQTAKVKKVMEEFKNGTLKSSNGEKVTDRKQALAIAMSEAGIKKE